MDITKQEKLVIYRRRLNLTQNKAAKFFEVSISVYRSWERPEGDAPAVKLGPIKNYELCWLKRVRANVSQGSLAEAIGYSRWWLIQMEKGGADPKPLIEYWKG